MSFGVILQFLCTLSHRFAENQQKKKACCHYTCGTRGLAVSEVWPQAGRATAHPWMTCPTRPEGRDNGQSLLTLHVCQNVSTLNNGTSTPYMVRHRHCSAVQRTVNWLLMESCGRQATLSCPQPLTQSIIIFCVSYGLLLISHPSQV